jgi:hypothetical protein
MLAKGADLMRLDVLISSWFFSDPRWQLFFNPIGAFVEQLEDKVKQETMPITRTCNRFDPRVRSRIIFTFAAVGCSDLKARIAWVFKQFEAPRHFGEPSDWIELDQSVEPNHAQDDIP